MISITTEVLWRSRETGVTWYDPFPMVTSSETIMLVQPVYGSDAYGGVVERTTLDDGLSWSDPRPVDAFAALTSDTGATHSVVGPVPLYHPPTDTVVAVGTTAESRDNTLVKPTTGRSVVYAVRGPDGTWSELRTLEWDDPRATAIYASSCLQSLVLDNGDLLVGVQFMPAGGHEFRAATLRCTFDGEWLAIAAVGEPMALHVGRGLFEPSVIRYKDQFWLTLRAEDGRGYRARSSDGLSWTDLQPWAWQDGHALDMSTTQQHWLVHDGDLYLVYTRRTGDNDAVWRHRAPLLLAQVDPGTGRLLAETEQTVLPLLGDGLAQPSRVPYFGNFAVTPISEHESWVTDCALAPWDGFAGDTYLARIRTEPSTTTTETSHHDTED